ncbi:YolD-like family protein, partial [Mycobacterium tuberculosis]
MPEHKKMLREAEIEDMKLKKPILDEGQLQEINDLFVQSVQ